MAKETNGPFFRGAAIPQILLAAGAAAYVLAYLWTAWHRFRYPFTLEWTVEEYAVLVIQRILSGQKIYVEPSLEYVPVIYPPLYYYLSAGVAQLIDRVSLVPLRMVSIAASCGTFLVIYGIVRKETKSLLAGILSAGLFAATFKISGADFDIARVDMLHLFLLLASFYALRFWVSARGYAFAGLLLGLSLLTKQVALAVAVLMMIYAVLRVKKHAVYFIAVFMGITCVSIWALDAAHSGWYSYFVFDLPLQHRFRDAEWLFRFWQRHVLEPFAISLAFSVFYLAVPSQDKDPSRRLFYTLAAVGMAAVSWSARLRMGGYLNSLFHIYAILAILFGLGFHAWISAARQSFVRHFILFLAGVQLLRFYYVPAELVPSEQDHKANRQILRAIRNAQGDVFAPFHPYLTSLAGKKIHADASWIWDIMRSRDGRMKGKLADEMRQAFRDKRYGTIILPHYFSSWEDEDWDWWMKAGLYKYYSKRRSVYQDDRLIKRRRHFYRHNEYIYTPRMEVPAAHG